MHSVAAGERLAAAQKFKFETSRERRRHGEGRHAVPSSGDVTHGYVHASLEHVRECVVKVSVFLLERAGVASGTQV